MADTLGPLEMQVLGLLDAREPASVAEIQRRLEAAGQRNAYTTVMTVLSRLHEKGLVLRRKQGNRYLYRSRPDQGRVKQGLLRKVQKALFSDRVKPIAALLDEDISRAELLQLRRLINERLKDK